MAHKDPTDEFGKSLVNELKSVELFPQYNAKLLGDIAVEITNRNNQLVSDLS